MEMYIHIAVFIGIASFVVLYHYKRRAEKKMGTDIDALVEADDWRGVCRILRRQLLIWGGIFVLLTVHLVLRIIEGEQYYTAVAVMLFIAWRVVKLAKLYRISLDNAKVIEEQQEPVYHEPLCKETCEMVEAILEDCRFTYVDKKATVEELQDLWRKAQERGRREGFCPVLLEMSDPLMDSLMGSISGETKADFIEWRQQMKGKPIADGKAFLAKRLEDEHQSVVQDYGEAHWHETVVGTDLHYDATNGFYFNTDTIMLVEVPVKNPWEIFLYIPVGGWNECPEAEDHMAVAKYWYETYGATVAYISCDVIGYTVPQPVTGDTMKLAEEQFAYCPDAVYQGYDNLATLAAAMKDSTVWHFWWD